MVKKSTKVKVWEEEEEEEEDGEESEELPESPPEVKSSEKENLLVLYQRLKDLGIRSISDLENLIARAE